MLFFFFFSCLFLLFLFVEEKPYWAYVILNVCSYSTKIKISMSMSLVGLVCPMHSPFCHKMWSVLSLTWSVLSCGGPFCPWSVLSMVRYVPNSSSLVSTL